MASLMYDQFAGMNYLTREAGSRDKGCVLDGIVFHQNFGFVFYLVCSFQWNCQIIALNMPLKSSVTITDIVINQSVQQEKA